MQPHAYPSGLDRRCIRLHRPRAHAAPRTPPAGARREPLLRSLGRTRPPVRGSRSRASSRRCATAPSPRPSARRARSSSSRRRPRSRPTSRRSSSPAASAWWTSRARSGSPTPAAYPAWYGFAHPAPELLAEARYGLPELARAGLAGARLVTNPGCYATAIALAVAPLVKARLASPDGIVVTGLSGVSGAGRKASEDYSFVEVDEDLRAYRLGRHQHVPEIEQTVAPPRRCLRPDRLHAGARPHPARDPRRRSRSGSRAAPGRRSRGRAARRLRGRAVRARPGGGQGDGEGRAPHEPLPRRRRARPSRAAWRSSPPPSTTS